MKQEFLINKEKEKLQETFDACIQISPHGIVAFDYKNEKLLVWNPAFDQVFD